VGAKVGRFGTELGLAEGDEDARGVGSTLGLMLGEALG